MRARAVEPADGANRLETRHSGEPQVHERDVRAAAREDVERLLAGRGRPHDLHVRLPPDDELEALAHDRMIVHAQHADARGWHHSNRCTFQRDSSGSSTLTSVPAPGRDVTVHEPPAAAARSLIALRP